MKPSEKRKQENSGNIPGALAESGGECGVIKIHEGVISTIVRRSACEVEGVARIAGSTLVDNIAEIVGSKKMQDRSITVCMNGSSVAVELAINVCFGVHLPTVAAGVQVSVAREIHRITGLSVSKVNVIVREMDELKDEELR
jgi:uncharacterized alkaline shock family protein YloU